MKNKEIDNFIEILTTYMPLNAEHIDMLAGQVQVRQLKKNRPLPNFRNDYLFVSSGLLKKEDCDSGDILLFLKPGDIELFATEAETYHYISLEESTVVLFPVKLVTELLQHRALIAGYQQLVHRWCALRCSRQELLLLKASEKKAELYRRLGKSVNSISNKDLARYLAMDSSYFSSL
jgi:CRP-like cAMP-binding protein